MAKNIFSTARIKLNEILDDITTYTRDVYNQSDDVFSPASAWGQVILVLSRLAHLIFFYIEDSVTELNIKTATRDSSKKSLITLTGHNPSRAIAATGEVNLISTGQIPTITGQYVTIPAFVKINCKSNGLPYLLSTGQSNYKVNVFQNKNKILCKIIQGVLETQTFTGTGEVIQSYECNMAPGKDIDNYFVNVFVNGRRCQQYSSFVDMPKDTYACIVRNGLTSGIDVIFGNGYNGIIPPLGSIITVEYLVTNGSFGNIEHIEDIVFEFDGEGYDVDGNSVDLNELFTISINNPISFGADAESLDLSLLLAPHTSRNFVLATTDNYKLFFEKMQMFSQISIFTDYVANNLYIDNVIYFLLVPDITKKIRTGENYFTCPLNFFSLTDYEKFKISKVIEESGQKMITSVIKFVDPKFKKYGINIYINTWKGFSKDGIYDEIISKLSDYFLKFNRKDYLPKSDLIALIEAVNGVDSVSLYFISESIESEIVKIINSTLDSSNNNTINQSNILTDSEKTTLLTEYAKTENDSLSNRADILLQQPSFQVLALNHINEIGDIAITTNEIPLIRGGFKDRFNRYYDDVLSQSKLGSVNITFLKENTKTR